MELPTKKVKAVTKSPRKLLIYSLPKTGKTTAVAQLDDCLIVDLERGTDMVDALKVQADDVSELKEIVSALKQKKEETGKAPYKYIAIDTATKLEDFSESIAVGMYKATAMGSKFRGDIVELKALPMGAGYKYVRDAYKFLLNQFVPLCETLILIGHTKDKYLSKGDKDVTSTEVDLTGKLSQIVCQNVDAIGYVYRKKNQLFISFKTDGDITSGNRSPHLSGQEFLLAESDPNTFEVKTYWDKIFVKE